MCCGLLQSFSEGNMWRLHQNSRLFFFFLKQIRTPQPPAPKKIPKTKQPNHPKTQSQLVLILQENGFVFVDLLNG